MADIEAGDRRQKATASEPCPECGRAFSRKDSLVRHLKVHGSNAERGPLHRIVYDKFRACASCRRAKVRCPGGLPCTRCEQLKRGCIYEPKNKKRRLAKSSVASPSDDSATEADSDPARSLISPRPSATEHEGSQSPGLSSRAILSPIESMDGSQQPPTVTMQPPSPQTKASITSHPVIPGHTDIRTALLNHGKEFSLIQSPYVSPNLQILDPYSYKLPSIAGSNEGMTPTQSLVTSRYPVLRYLAPFIDVDFSSSLACDLLDTYFSSAFTSRMHPLCHHLHNFIVRRCDVIDPVYPRRMHPALLASMLFVAALSDKALGLFNGPEEREKNCKYLSLLTYRLLNPSRHEPLLSQEDLGLAPYYATATGFTNQDIQRALDPQSSSECLPMTWGVDYIITFIHVSSVISGSEKKAASIRWWSAAFSLARDLKLNQEIETYHIQNASNEPQPSLNCGCTMPPEPGSDSMTEVHREERRRTWWLLFLMDRHLALCYNRPLALLEAECKDLLVPLDDVSWQSGQQLHSHGTDSHGPRCMLQPAGTGRPHGPPTTCTGPGLFEFFLPLMTITGHLLDFNRAKNHPVLVSADSSMFSSQERQILREIDQYQSSLDAITNASQPPIRRDSQPQPPEPRWPSTMPPTLASDPSDPSAFENPYITLTFSAYASHILSVLRILVGSKWDPISLFEDLDFWTSSPSFKDSMSHTISAAASVSSILLHDPDVSFMPYFFGIQLLHGSLLLLLVAYRLQGDSGAVILDACEAVVRATEACFVTLPTDYQRQMRNVMRSAIALARGRGVKGGRVETEKQLASVLARYRWSREGAGLARGWMERG